MRTLSAPLSVTVWLSAGLLLLVGCNKIERELKAELLKKAVAAAGPKRNVPHHDLTITADCSADGMEKIEGAIGRAIEVGAPTYNRGDHEGCYKTYERATQQIDRSVQGCKRLRQALLQGIENASARTDYTGKAWAMRDAFDGALEVIERKRGGAELAFVPKREVPHHDAAVFEGCSKHDIEETEQGIARAIAVGAPLYNQKNAEACYRVYQGAALDLVTNLKGCEGAKRALKDGLARADVASGSEAKAWAMRDAFDGILEVIDRN